ncbi:carboxypeptidase-like regulatory domain-containing protein [Cognatitamlana onchidii]|uniref:carboxypeptidase-like regulatory domain-containing protein n=1 Tax=Cognatitamlana onchidii TaxID=2562860 RepID=UPI0010A5FB93|nr:carboxypeptidase-like regulatory domain-containing protein [Algibacter onchidii]
MKNLALLSLGCVFLFALVFPSTLLAQTDEAFTELKGKVVDAQSKKPLVFTDVVVNNSNISTVTNTEGEFLIKIPERLLAETIIVSHLGFEKKEFNISAMDKLKEIVLNPVVTTLNEISIISTNIDAKDIVLEALKKKGNAYTKENTLMTAFYRETIKKRRKNASLSEAVVKIHKQPYFDYRNDNIELIKARKNTNYTKLDTLALKLQGGPFSNLYTDMIKYPEYIFTEDDLPLYKFQFENSTQINNRLIYVIGFKQKEDYNTPLYFGKLYIDAETRALTSAVYSLDVSNKTLSSRMYVRKKPKKVDVYPTEASYRVNYRIKDDKWYYAYSNITLTFKVNWKGKLFNSSYTLNSEMAVTDWQINNQKLASVKRQLIRPSTILSEKASGFSDPRFWGAYNIIEPEKSIESAIKKIQKQLKRT